MKESFEKRRVKTLIRERGPDVVKNQSGEKTTDAKVKVKVFFSLFVDFKARLRLAVVEFV
jgi:hypothetical protein